MWTSIVGERTCHKDTFEWRGTGNSKRLLLCHRITGIPTGVVSPLIVITARRHPCSELGLPLREGIPRFSDI